MNQDLDELLGEMMIYMKYISQQCNTLAKTKYNTVLTEFKELIKNGIMKVVRMKKFRKMRKMIPYQKESILYSSSSAII